MKSLNNLIISIICLFILASCGRNTTYNKYLPTNDGKWHMEEVMSFDVDMQDTVSHYNILLGIRHNTSYKYQNLWLFVNSYSPDSIPLRDTVECYLSNNKGEWLGKGIGDNLSMQVLYLQKIRFPKYGNYHFEISHAMRDETLVGIENIGLEIQKIE